MSFLSGSVRSLWHWCLDCCSTTFDIHSWFLASTSSFQWPCTLSELLLDGIGKCFATMDGFSPCRAMCQVGGSTLILVNIWCQVWFHRVISSAQDLTVHTFSSQDLKKTDWGAILDTVPAMLALTFFGILHVPINVPALGVSTKRDDIDTNRELVAHGWSNLLSGGVGSVQSMSLIYAFMCTTCSPYTV